MPADAKPPLPSGQAPDLTRGPLRFPDFLGIGAQKAGTTWLHENLRRHPAIWMPPIKELQYFNDLYIPGHRQWTAEHRRTHASRALRWYIRAVPEEKWDYRWISRTADIIDGVLCDEWYGRIFTFAASDQACGEFTPEYSLLPPAGIEHVLRLSPEAKIILSLRDPIERNWSHIRMMAQRTAVGAADLLRFAAFADVIARSDYPAIIDRWGRLLPQKQLLVTFMDDIEVRPEGVMREVCAYLDVEFDKKFFPSLAKKIHVGESIDIPPDVHKFLKEQLEPIYEKLVHLYPEIAKRWRARHY